MTKKMARKKVTAKTQTAMQEHMAKIRSMRGKGKKRKGGSRWKKLTNEVKSLKKEVSASNKLIARMAKQSGAVKRKPIKRRKRK